MHKLTSLCEIAFKYGTDKCPQIGHDFTPYYYEFLKDKRETFKKVLELGVGARETMQWVPNHYQKGAGLLMWRDFFPNAQIYGVDKDQRAIFQAERITTFQLDTTRRYKLTKLIENVGSDIDLVIDDGDHREKAQLRAVQILKPLLKGDVIYIIEDALRPFTIRDKLSRDYDCQVVELPYKFYDDTLIIVRKK